MMKSISIFIIQVGQTMVSLDCTTSYSCNATGKAPIEKRIAPCGLNAVCTVQNNVPTCICKPGFFGNGVSCSNGS